MKPSPEIEKLFRDLSAALEHGDMSAIEQATSAAPEVVTIGTAPDEYSRSRDETMRMMREAAPPAVAVHLELGALHAYEEGDAGWIDATASFLREGGAETVGVRLTGVCRREQGEWRIVQSHASIGVPNDHMFDSIFRA